MKFDQTTFISVSEQIAQAIAQDDEGRAYCASRERIEQPEQPEQQGLVFENAPATPGKRTMDDEEQKAWDAWCRAHIEQFRRADIEPFADDVGQCIGTLEKQVAELQAEVSKLRADNEVMRSIMRGEVPVLKRRNRDVA